MVTLCSFVLDSGRRCAAPARRGSPFCRHHPPSSPRTHSPDSTLAEAAEPGRSGPLPRSAFSAHWRTYGPWIAESDSEALRNLIEELLMALGDRMICHRSAGRLFQAIEDRRRRLQREAQQARLREMQESIFRLLDERGQHVTTGPLPPEALWDLPRVPSDTASGPLAKNGSNRR